MTDKRLQFRRVDGVFNGRDAATRYVSNLTSGQTFDGLYGEPIVAKYKEDGKDHLLLAVGVESGMPYHIIDTYGLELDINKLQRDIAGLNSGSSASYSEIMELIGAESRRLDDKIDTVSSALTKHISDSETDKKYVKRITYDKDGQKLIASYDDKNEDVPLRDLVDIYRVNDNSRNYLNISSTTINDRHVSTIEAIVNDNNGHNNTLATTNYVVSGVNRAISELENKLYQNTESQGSIKNIIFESLVNKPVANADTGQTLIRRINIGDMTQYFVSNDAHDMVIVANGATHVLSTYIEDLERRIAYLESVIGTTTEQVGNLTNIIKNTIQNYIIGTEKEIEIRPNNDKLQIGFPDNAIFGPNQDND